MHIKNSLIVLSGPSGSGKGTISKELIKRNKNIVCSISATSRECKEKEMPNVNYYYIGKKNFLNKIKENLFLEYAKVYDNYYGTLKSEVFSKLKKGYDVLLEIDIQGALQIKNKCKNSIFIFILPPSFQELKKRINTRKRDSIKDINKRMNEFSKELNYITEYDYIVINDFVENAVKKIEAILIAEKCHLNKIMLDVNKFIKE